MIFLENQNLLNVLKFKRKLEDYLMKELNNGVFAGRRVRQKNQFVFQKANGFQFGDPHFKAYCLNSAG